MSITLERISDTILNTTVNMKRLPTWPLPATQAPNAHLTWAEWLDAQADGGATQGDSSHVRAMLQHIA